MGRLWQWHYSPINVIVGLVLRIIGLLGGTFNPIHKGHLQTASALKRQLNFDEMRLLPCHIPAHRQLPAISNQHRIAMLELAITDYPELIIDYREMSSDNISYSISSLKQLRLEQPNSSLCFCVGLDAFNQILSWKCYQSLLDYCHIVVVKRQLNDREDDIKPAIKTYFNSKFTQQKTILSNQLNGFIYCCALRQIAISSTQIREALALNNPIEQYLSASVAQYVQRHQLYTL